MQRLVKLIADSVYFDDRNHDNKFEPAQGETLSKLPDRMLWSHPALAVRLSLSYNALKELGIFMTLSDLFRSHDMQLRANLDYKLGQLYTLGENKIQVCQDEAAAAKIRDMAKQAGFQLSPFGKKPFSPPPGSSMHEVGLAADVNLEWNAKDGSTYNQTDRAAIRKILMIQGLTPIAELGFSEEWHFEARTPVVSIYNQIYSDAIAKKASATVAHALAYKAMVTQALNIIELPPYADGNFETVKLEDAFHLAA